jgi:hypothetical protein
MFVALFHFVTSLKEDFLKEEAKYQAGQAKKKRAKKPNA